MKTLHISDEVYDKLKAFVVDPFDDTPNAVLLRLIDIASKAQKHWCAFAPAQQAESPKPAEDPSPNNAVPPGTRIPDAAAEGTAVML